MANLVAFLIIEKLAKITVRDSVPNSCEGQSIVKTANLLHAFLESGGLLLTLPLLPESTFLVESKLFSRGLAKLFFKFIYHI